MLASQQQVNQHGADSIVRLLEENNSLIKENNTLLKSIDDKLRRIAINTNGH